MQKSSWTREAGNNPNRINPILPKTIGLEQVDQIPLMLTAILTPLAILSAALHIRAEHYGPRYHVYLFKPLTMAFILLMAVRAGWPDLSRYKVAILAGLVCSLAGDVFLMLPSDRFIAGLVSFLLAHLLAWFTG